LQDTVRVVLVHTGVKSQSLVGKELYTGPVKPSAEVDEVRCPPPLFTRTFFHFSPIAEREHPPPAVSIHRVPSGRSSGLPTRGNAGSSADNAASTVARGLRTFIGPRPNNPSRKGRGDPRAECHRNARGRIGPRDDRWDLRDDSRSDPQVSEPNGRRSPRI